MLTRLSDVARQAGRVRRSWLILIALIGLPIVIFWPALASWPKRHPVAPPVSLRAPVPDRHLVVARRFSRRRPILEPRADHARQRRHAVADDEWYIRDAGWHLTNGNMLVTPDASVEPPRPSGPSKSRQAAGVLEGEGAYRSRWGHLVVPVK